MNKHLEKRIKGLGDKLTLVLDFDGTMFEARFSGEHLMNYSREEVDLLRHSLETDVYEDMKPIAKVQDLVKQVSDLGAEIIVLTHVHNGIEVIQKQKAIAKHFKEIPSDKLYGVHSLEHKIETLRLLAKTRNIVYIDDYLEFCLQLNDIVNRDNVAIYHVSSLFVD